MKRWPLALVLLPLAVQAQSSAEGAANPFSTFETHVLDNGLRLWIAPLAGAADVSVGVAVPYGWDEDPDGLEQLAHYTEHMLFADHRGRSEEEILAEVETRGGRRNGITTPDHTFYYVTLPAEHGLFGLDWLASVMEPKAMEPEVVERNRQPVALEVRARPREFFDHVGALLDPDWLRPPEYWGREFGLRTRAAHRWDAFRSLQDIGPDALRGFYDFFYAPAAMTLVVAGDVEPDSVLAAARRTFGALPARPAPASYGPLVDPGRAYRNVTWTSRPDVRYRRIFKIYDMDADAHVKLLFVARYLDRRLSNRLRFGEVKAVYGVSVRVVQRGPATHLVLDAPIDPEQWEYARDVVEDELARLAAGDMPEADFRADRDAVTDQLAAENREAEDLVFWVHRVFYRPQVHDHFPDLVAEFAALEPGDLAAFVRERFVPTREVTFISRPQPLGQGGSALAAIVLGFLTFRLVAGLLITPAAMRDIRYVARVRMSPPVFLAAFGLFAAVGLAGARLLVAGVQWAVSSWVLPVDVYLYQMGAFALLGAIGLSLFVAYLSLPPRKVLVFGDHVRVKHLSFRSRVMPVEGLRARVATLATVAREGGLLRTVPLALGMGRSAIWLRPERGRGYLIGVRDPDEMLEVLADVGADTGVTAQA
jgi:predicted Zn-dependent peptidase